MERARWQVDWETANTRDGGHRNMRLIGVIYGEISLVKLPGTSSTGNSEHNPMITVHSSPQIQELCFLRLSLQDMLADPGCRTINDSVEGPPEPFQACKPASLQASALFEVITSVVGRYTVEHYVTQSGLKTGAHGAELPEQEPIPVRGRMSLSFLLPVHDVPHANYRSFAIFQVPKFIP